MPLDDDVIEHGESASDRRLRGLRLRIALGIALVEGIVVLAGGLPFWLTVLFAVVAVTAYLGVGRSHPRSRVRSITWIAAVSQLVVVVVPALVAVAVALAVVVLVLLGIAVLTALLLDRR
jgi:hypothetical protein